VLFERKYPIMCSSGCKKHIMSERVSPQVKRNASAGNFHKAE
jgi:hypothetical protein